MTEPGTTITEPVTSNMLTGKSISESDKIIKVNDLDFYYGTKQALFNVNLEILRHKVTALIGPSGCGKSTFLRCLNRMNDLIPGTRAVGKVFYRKSEQISDILAEDTDVIELRRNVGMVFQKSNPFPKSIFENVVYGLRIAGYKDKEYLNEIFEQSLKKAALWDEVKDRANESAMGLSGGQMQRLCIARAIAINPDIILMDEPCSALDPRSTARIEDLIQDLGNNYTIIIVTHNMQQAGRVADYTAFFNEGSVIEYGETEQIFTKPVQQATEDYITGRFG